MSGVRIDQLPFVSAVEQDYELPAITSDEVTVKISVAQLLNYLQLALNFGDPGNIPEWQPGVEYSAGKEFTFSTTNTTAVDANGDDIPANKVLIGAYTATTTSGSGLTNVEMQLIELRGGGGGISGSFTLEVSGTDLVLGVPGQGDLIVDLGLGEGSGQTIQDLGDVSGVVNLDIQAYDAYRFNATADVTVNFVNPPAAGVHKPVTVYATRTSATNATISFGTSISWVGSQVVPGLLDNQTTVFSVSTTNAGTSYLGFSNGLVFEITASGDAATWNPNDLGPYNLLIEDGKTLVAQDAGSNDAPSLSRMFGAKNSGKWQISLRVALGMSFSSSGSERLIGFGLATLAAQLNNYLGGGTQVAGSTLCLRAYDASDSSSTISYNKVSQNEGQVAVPAFPYSTGTLYNLLVDLDLGKVWFLIDGVPLEGDPNAGTGESLTFTPGDFWYPAASVCTDGSQIWLSVFNEIENPYLNDFPSFAHWTI